MMDSTAISRAFSSFLSPAFSCDDGILPITESNSLVEMLAESRRVGVIMMGNGVCHKTADAGKKREEVHKLFSGV